MRAPRTEPHPSSSAAVKLLLARSWSSEDDLECGPVEGSRLRHNCSGKHAGMLAVCAARGWPREDYRLPDHPLQQEIVALVAEAAGAKKGLPTAIDGCGVVTFALPLENMADGLRPARARRVRRAPRGSSPR